MVSRHAAALITSALSLWLYSTSSDAAVTHTTANLQFEVGTLDDP